MEVQSSEARLEEESGERKLKSHKYSSIGQSLI